MWECKLDVMGSCHADRVPTLSECGKVGVGPTGQDTWVGASYLCASPTACWDVHCVAIFEKARACFIITKTVNDLHSLLSSKTFHDLFGTLLGDSQLFTFSDVRSPTYKWTKSIFTLAFVHF